MVEQKTINSCRSLDHACGNGSIIDFNDLRKSIEIYIYARKKPLFTSYLNLPLRTWKKNQWTIFIVQHVRQLLAPTIILLT